MNTVNTPRNPVLLVHGIFDTGQVFRRMTAYLNQKGWKVYNLDLIPNTGYIGLEELAQQVANYVNAAFPPEQPIDVVGFSMGGIVSRYYIQRLGGIKRVQRFVTISSPHHGTWVAFVNPIALGYIQMRPDSTFLQDLNRDVEILQQVGFTSIWTPYDLMIIPASSSHMPIGKEVIIPVLNHAWMLTDPNSLAAVAEALSIPIETATEHHQFVHPQDYQKSPQGNGNI